MIGILVATHGEFSKGLLNAVELVYGKQDRVKTVGLFHGDGVDEFTEKVKFLITELDDGDGVLVLVDMNGGTPGNTVMKVTGEFPRMRAVAGVNMPMLVTAVSERDEAENLDALCQTCMEIGHESIVSLYEAYQEILKNAVNADDDDF